MNTFFGDFENYVEGGWVPSESGLQLEQFSPSDGSLVSRVPDSTEKDARQAVAVAREAFFGTGWAMDPRGRSKALLAWARRMAENREELAFALTMETGKPLREARGEIQGAINYMEYYAAAARTLNGNNFSLDSGHYSFLVREPVGVVGIIVPWNYPVTLLMRDLAPALAAGNTVVIKPARQTSGVTMKCIGLLEGLEEIPAGVVNAICGRGSRVGNVLVADPRVDMIQFTGSSDTGKDIMREASGTMKKLSLELGGKSASIIFADADMGKALPYAIRSIFTNAGQLCTSASRLLVEESVAPMVLEELKKRAEALKVGPGYLEENDMGAITMESQMETVLSYIEQGRRDGRVLTGGQRLTGDGLDKGFFVAPTILTDLPQNSPVVQEEIFGPVLTVQTFRTPEEAVDMANGTRFGLASGIWSQNLTLALDTARKMRAGTAWINTYNRLLPEAETGGYQESGISRSGGQEGLMKFTEVKHICVETNS